MLTRRHRRTRDASAAGDRVTGPAVIVERETSTVVTSPFDAVMQSDGAILLAPERECRMSERSSEIRMQVMWNRLISVVEEQAMTLAAHRLLHVRARGRRPVGGRVRPARAGCWRRRSPARPATSTRWPKPCCISWPRSARGEMFEGDTYVTNDPWKGTGHLHDITMVSPSFLDGELVGFFACTAHVVDVGGRGFGADGKSVYEEGIQIPIMKFAETRQGQPRPRADRCAANVREPNQVVGDFYSLAACNEVGHRRLVDMMNEIGLDYARRARRRSSSRAPATRRCERITRAAEGQLVERADDRRIRRAGQARGRRLDRARPCRCRLCRHATPVSRWGINVPDHLHQGLCLLCPEMRGRAGHPQQLPPRWPSSRYPRPSTS